MVKSERECVVCSKHFKPMTDKQWNFVYNILHVPYSIRHRKYLELDRR